MAQQNFLLGKGERLTADISMKSGGGPKQAPYTFNEARGRLAPMLASTAAKIDKLPPEACPGDQAVISLTLNPEYIAKSYFPSELLHDVGIDVVGSRPRRTTPQKRSRGREAVETLTTELFAKGRRSTIRAWSESLPDWRADRRSASDLVSIEEIAAPVPGDKIKGHLPELGHMALETVLHASELEAQTYMFGPSLHTSNGVVLKQNLAAGSLQKAFVFSKWMRRSNAPRKSLPSLASGRFG